MRILANRDIKSLFSGIIAFLAGFIVLSQATMRMLPDHAPLCLAVLSLLMGGGILASCARYFSRQSRAIRTAISQIDAYLAGDADSRIDCDYDGELYKLFHSVNTLAAVLNAHTQNEFRSKEFLKDTISDISHQLKTPLAALNIYNGLLQGVAEDIPDIKEFVDLSEQELDRIEVLVQNLLKITKLDAGTLVTQKAEENISDMMGDIEQHFTYRAKQEQKTLLFSGADDSSLFCDRNWITEAISNLVKNAFDHTKPGDSISVEWKSSSSYVQIVVKDTGSGIHPEDMYHIFKRFYRSRFSQDTQGVGLGLSLTKAIVEEHNGTIQADSVLGQGSVFTVNFLITTKL